MGESIVCADESAHNKVIKMVVLEAIVWAWWLQTGLVISANFLEYLRLCLHQKALDQDP